MSGANSASVPALFLGPCPRGRWVDSDEILAELRGVRSDALDVALWAQSEIARSSVDPGYIQSRQAHLLRRLEYNRATINHGADIPHMLPRLSFWLRLRIAMALLLLP